MFVRIKKWLYSYPDPNDTFGVNIRKCFQTLFPCNHVWRYDRGKYRRKCLKCWKRQHLVLYKYGNMNWEWSDLPDYYINSNNNELP